MDATAPPPSLAVNGTEPASHRGSLLNPAAAASLGGGVRDEADGADAAAGPGGAGAPRRRRRTRALSSAIAASPVLLLPSRGGAEAGPGAAAGSAGLLSGGGNEEREAGHTVSIAPHAMDAAPGAGRRPTMLGRARAATRRMTVMRNERQVWRAPTTSSGEQPEWLRDLVAGTDLRELGDERGDEEQDEYLTRRDGSRPTKTGEAPVRRGWRSLDARQRWNLSFVHEKTEYMYRHRNTVQTIKSIRLGLTFGGVFEFLWAVLDIVRPVPGFTLHTEKIIFMFANVVIIFSLAAYLGTAHGRRNVTRAQSPMGLFLVISLTAFQVFDILGDGPRYMYGLALAFWGGSVVMRQLYSQAIPVAGIGLVTSYTMIAVADQYSPEPVGATFLALQFLNVATIVATAMIGIYFRERDSRRNFMQTFEKLRREETRRELLAAANKLVPKILPGPLAKHFIREGIVARWNPVHVLKDNRALFKSVLQSFTASGDVAVLACHVSDFSTRACSKGGQSLVDLNRLYGDFASLARRAKSKVLYMVHGNVFLVIGGILDDASGDAIDVAKVALEFQRYVRKRAEHDAYAFRVQFGLTLGPVVAGMIASDRRLVYDVVETAAVAMAKQLAHLAPPEVIYASSECRNELRAMMSFTQGAQERTLGVFTLGGSGVQTRSNSVRNMTRIGSIFNSVRLGVRLASVAPVDVAPAASMPSEAEAMVSEESEAALEFWLESNKLTQRFLDPSVERRYERFVATSSRHVLRLNALILLGVWSISGFQDLLYARDSDASGIGELELIRYAAAVPVLLSVLAVTFVPHLPVMQSVISAAMACFGAATIAMLFVADRAVLPVYALAYMRVYITAHTSVRLRNVNAIGVTAVIFVAYIACGLAIDPDVLDRRIILYSVFFCVFGALNSYGLERGSRRLFLTMRAVEHEEILCETIRENKLLYMRTLLPLNDVDGLANVKTHETPPKMFDDVFVVVLHVGQRVGNEDLDSMISAATIAAAHSSIAAAAAAAGAARGSVDEADEPVPKPAPAHAPVSIAVPSVPVGGSTLRRSSTSSSALSRKGSTASVASRKASTAPSGTDDLDALSSYLESETAGLDIPGAEVVDDAQMAAEDDERDNEVLEAMLDLFIEFDKVVERYGMRTIRTEGGLYVAVAREVETAEGSFLNAGAACIDAVGPILHGHELLSGLNVRVGVAHGTVLTGHAGLGTVAFGVYGTCVDQARQLAIAPHNPGLLLTDDALQAAGGLDRVRALAKGPARPAEPVFMADDFERSDPIAVFGVSNQNDAPPAAIPKLVARTGDVAPETDISIVDEELAKV